MFKHIGKKWKVLAIIIFIIDFVLFLGFGAIFIIAGITAKGNMASFMGYTIEGAPGLAFIILGALIIIFGFLASWISAWVPYGVGQMIDNTDKMVDMQNELINRMGGVLQQQQQQMGLAQQTLDLQAQSVNAVPMDYTAPVSDITSEDVPVDPENL